MKKISLLEQVQSLASSAAVLLCLATQAQAKPLIVGFAQVGAESSWRTAETDSVKAEAAKLGVTLKFSDAQGKQENEIKAVRGFIAQGVDAIVLAPVVETGWEPVLREAKRAKIPVMLLDRGIKVSDDSLFTTLICSDFVSEGRMAGEWRASGSRPVREMWSTWSPGVSLSSSNLSCSSRRLSTRSIAARSGP